ncbi:MAG TPA: hypothetical protein VLK65_01010 [Vicinamibacteria bacterium]|nr:hypothetical protein [Vicinamibacteria bacterium]
MKARRVGKGALLTFSLLQGAAYVLLVRLEAVRASTLFDAVNIDFTGDWLSQAANVLASIAGYSMVYLTPGLLWIAKTDDRSPAELLIKSALMSLVLYTVLFSVLKLVSVELSRTWMVLAYFVIALVWAVLDRRSFSLPLDRSTLPLVSGGAVVLALLLLLHGKVYPENFSGDGTESFEFSRSLKTNVFPYWDLENGHYGFYPRFMFFAYSNVLSILHVGEIPAAVRLPFFIVLFGIYVLIAALVGVLSARDRRLDRFVISGGIALFAIFNVFYSTWHPHFADIAEPTHVDTLVTFYLLSAVYFFVEKEPLWFLISCFFASLSVANGIGLAFFLLATLFCTEPRKKRVVLLALGFLFIYGGYLGLVALYDRFHPLGSHRWSLAGMLDYFSWTDLLVPVRYVPHVKYLLMMTGVLPILFVPWIGKRDGLSRAVYLTGIVYVVAVFFFGRYNPHYFTSVALLFLVPFLRTLNSMDPDKARYVKVVYLACMLAIVAAIFPLRYVVNQEAKALGARTCIEATDYRTQVDLAESIYRLFPFQRYGVGHHTLVFYAAKGTCSRGEYDYILSAQESGGEREGYVRVGPTDLLVRIGIERAVPPTRKYNGNSRFLLKEVYRRNR